MNSTFKTTGGTAVFEPTDQEFGDYLERRVQARLHMSVSEFRKAHEAGRLDEADPAVSELASLLRLGHNSH